MRKIIALVLTVCTVLCLLTGCSAQTAAQNTGYADKTEFLKDMAEGINNRLADVADENSMPTEEKMAYYEKKVGYELDAIGKYEDAVFEDETFNELAHHYIEACRMQLFAAQNYKNSNIYTLWSYGLGIRESLITELYSRYNLPITAEQAAKYSGGSDSSYTVTTTTESNGSTTVSSYSGTTSSSAGVSASTTAVPDTYRTVRTDLTYINVDIEATDSSDLSYQYSGNASDIKVSQDDSYISVTQPQSGNTSFTGKAPTLVIYVPKSCTLTGDISTMSGDVEVNFPEIDSLSLDLMSGDATIDCDTLDDTSISTMSGKIVIDAESISNIIATAMSGNVTVNGKISGSSEISSMSGKVKVNGKTIS